MTKFKTRNGRDVFDGGGINPDIIINQPKVSNIILSLAKKRLFFDYTTNYRFLHEKISDNFLLSEKEYNDFVNFLKNKEYSYITKTE